MGHIEVDNLSSWKIEQIIINDLCIGYANSCGFPGIFSETEDNEYHIDATEGKADIHITVNKNINSKFDVNWRVIRKNLKKAKR